ncbi:FAD-binding oxidoreductase, partial [Nonlabens dokdonensis]
MNTSLLFNNLLNKSQILVGDALKDRYSHIWQMGQPLKALCVLLPENTNQVSEIMKICYQNDLPVVPHGGLTNLVGSTETFGNEVVISTERMDRIEEIDKSSRTITVQAGVIL